MPSPRRYYSGSWNVICDVCGRQYKAEGLRPRWDGLMVCLEDWEPRQPQDFVRAQADKIAPPWSRSESSDTFIQFCTVYTVPGISGVGTAGCAVAGKLPIYAFGT